MECTILEKDQIFGHNRLKIFEKGTEAAITDYAICCYGYVSNCYADDIEKLENRTGWYWTKTDDGDNYAHVIASNGDAFDHHVDDRNGGVRPALPFSRVKSICSNRERANSHDGILEVEFGEYPQQAVSKKMQDELERLFKRKKLNETGKNYTRDKTIYYDYNQKFQEEKQKEYEYNGKKYVRVRVNSYYDGRKFQLSNGELYKDGDYVWIEVSPIKGKVDLENDKLISDKLILAGIQFNNTRDYKGDFETTGLYWYLNTYFVKEIMPVSIYKKENITIPNEKSIYQKSVDEIRQQLLELMQFMPENLKIRVCNKYNSIIDEYFQNRQKEKENIFYGKHTFLLQDSTTTLFNKLTLLQVEIVANNKAILNLQKISRYRELFNNLNQEKLEGQTEDLIQNIKTEIESTYVIYEKIINDKVESIFHLAEEEFQLLLENVFENNNTLNRSLNSNSMDKLNEELAQLLDLLRNSNLKELVKIQNAFSQESTDLNINSLSDNIKTMNYVVKNTVNDLDKEKWDNLKQQYNDYFSSLFSKFLNEKNEHDVKIVFDNLRKDLFSYVNWILTFADVDNYRLKKTEELLNAEKIYAFPELRDEIKPTVSSLLTEEINHIKVIIEDCKEADIVYHIQIEKTVDKLKLASDKETIDQIMQQFYKNLTDIWAQVWEYSSFHNSKVILKKL